MGKRDVKHRIGALELRETGGVKLAEATNKLTQFLCCLFATGS